MSNIRASLVYPWKKGLLGAAIRMNGWMDAWMNDG
jgi:hypothetical protein